MERMGVEKKVACVSWAPVEVGKKRNKLEVLSQPAPLKLKWTLRLAYDGLHRLG